MIPSVLEVPSNCWTKAEQSFVNALIASTAFQDICETTDPTEFVFLEEVSKEDGTDYTLEDLEQLRHYAIVTSSMEGGYGSTEGEGKDHEPYGIVQVVIRRLIREAERHNTPAIASRWFKNRVGDFMNELPAYMWDEGEAPIRNQIVEFGPRETTESRQPTQGFWLTCHLGIEWGFNA